MVLASLGLDEGVGSLGGDDQLVGILQGVDVVLSEHVVRHCSDP